MKEESVFMNCGEVRVEEITCNGLRRVGGPWTLGSEIGVLLKPLLGP